MLLVPLTGTTVLQYAFRVPTTSSEKAKSSGVPHGCVKSLPFDLIGSLKTGKGGVRSPTTVNLSPYDERNDMEEQLSLTDQ